MATNWELCFTCSVRDSNASEQKFLEKCSCMCASRRHLTGQCGNKMLLFCYYVLKQSTTPTIFCICAQLVDNQPMLLPAALHFIHIIYAKGAALTCVCYNTTLPEQSHDSQTQDQPFENCNYYQKQWLLVGVFSSPVYSF